MNATGLAGPSHELVRDPGHRRDDDGHLVAGVDFAPDASGDALDVLDIGDRSAAEFLNNSAHDPLERSAETLSARLLCCRFESAAAYSIFCATACSPGGLGNGEDRKGGCPGYHR